MTENKAQLTEDQPVGIINEEGGVEVRVTNPNDIGSQVFVRGTNDNLGYSPISKDKGMLPLPGFEEILKGSEPNYLGLTTDLRDIPAVDLSISERIRAGIINFQQFITGDRRRKI